MVCFGEHQSHLFIGVKERMERAEIPYCLPTFKTDLQRTRVAMNFNNYGIKTEESLHHKQNCSSRKIKHWRQRSKLLQ